LVILKLVLDDDVELFDEKTNFKLIKIAFKCWEAIQNRQGHILGLMMNLSCGPLS